MPTAAPGTDPVPAPAECRRLMAAMQMRPNIVDHSRQVCRVAEFLADSLTAVGVPLDRDLITAAALLHDITKTRSLETGENHAATGGAYLKARGFVRVGEIVRQHVALDRYGQNGPPDEAEIVNYSDKRVLHDTITGLDKRMTYIQERYGTTDAQRQRIALLWRHTIDLEKRLFTPLPFAPDTVTARLA